MATFILVHGAFQGSWVWDSTASLLRSCGHSVLTPTLTGLGDRAHLLNRAISLRHYVDDVVNTVCFAQAGPAIFVGHSFAGLVAAAAASSLKSLASGLIYVDAIIPEAGLSFRDLAGPAFEPVLSAHIQDGWLVKPWPISTFGVPGPELARDFAARLMPTPLAAFTDTYGFRLPDANLPKAFIRCTSNSNPLIAAQGAKAKVSGYDHTEIDTGHAPMVTTPKQLAEALMQCASKMPDKSLGTIDSSYFHERLLRAMHSGSGKLRGE